ncbi:MAG: FitA-like ribbon-helix-helix domain-containing protein [Steroidobacteraceae bacterium]
MAQIIVRQLDDDVKARLQRRADRHGRSMEAEVRDILRAAAKNVDGDRNPRLSGDRCVFAIFWHADCLFCRSLSSARQTTP